MAYFLRLIPAWGWFLVGCLLAGVPQLALADDYSAKVKYGAGANQFDTLTLYGQFLCPPGGTYTGAAKWTGVYEYGYTTSNHNSIYEYGESLYCQFQEGTSYGWATGGGVQLFYSCPYGGTLNGTTKMCVDAPPCTAPEVRDPATGQCVPPPDPCTENAGKWWSEGYGWNSSFPVEDFSSGEGSSIPTTGCVGGCVVTYEKSMGAYGSGKWWQIASAKATGQSCTAVTPQPTAPTTGPKTPETSPEYDCAKAGQGFGTVNGTVICTGPATNQTKEDKDTTKTTNPDGTQTETTKETTCTGGTCTETTTTTNCDANGNNCTSSTTTSTKTGQGDADEGEEEPESKWGGNCTAGFSCSGDAIQCAIAKEQHIRNCQLEPTQAHKDKGQNVIDGVLEANDPRRPENKGSEAFGNWSSEGGMTGSCPADFAVDLYGQTIVVPWSDLCPHFNAMGYAMLAVAWVIAASILRGVL